MIKRLSRDIRTHREKSEGGPPSNNLPHNLEPIQPAEALPPINLPIMNSFMNGTTRVQDSPGRTHSPSGTTIRKVPAEPLQLDTTPSRPNGINGTNGDSRRTQNVGELAQSSPAKSYGNISSHPPPSWQNNLPVPNGLVRTISSEFGPQKTFSSSTATEENGVTSPSDDPNAGRAGQTGKSGRVINQLIIDNNTLKRELQLSQARLEESKNAVKMAETKREQMASSMEREAQEAAYNAMQLKRRERLLAEAKEHIEYEKKRAADAETREKAWKDQLDEFRETATREVAQAKEKAAYFEASYTTVRGHWPGEQAKIDKAVARWKEEITALNKARKEDDEKIILLRSLSEQQAKLMTELERQNKSLHEAHQKYKDEQEQGLRDIKLRLQEQEEENERLLEESRETLGRLRWALGVKENVRDAQ